jgi:hypothetical protein
MSVAVTVIFQDPRLTQSNAAAGKLFTPLSHVAHEASKIADSYKCNFMCKVGNLPTELGQLTLDSDLSPEPWLESPCLAAA